MSRKKFYNLIFSFGIILVLAIGVGTASGNSVNPTACNALQAAGLGDESVYTSLCVHFHTADPLGLPVLPDPVSPVLFPPPEPPASASAAITSQALPEAGLPALPELGTPALPPLPVDAAQLPGLPEVAAPDPGDDIAGLSQTVNDALEGGTPDTADILAIVNAVNPVPAPLPLAP